MTIAEYNLHRLHLPLREPIGDSQVRFTDHWMTVLELHSDDGHTGVGFEIHQGTATPSLSDQTRRFEATIWPAICGEIPLGLAQRLQRPRGGNVGGGYLTLPVETALWDLVGKQLEQPLYRLLGGQSNRVPAYGSTLDFRLDDQSFRQKLERFRSCGFRAIKTKVGHPDINWDLRRLEITKQIMGDDVVLMVDANEAWSVKETLIRLHTYRDHGYDIFWIEDPITREDYAGYACLCRELPFCRINTGEYLAYSGKRRLLESNAVDVLNVHGSIGATRAAAWLAADYGVPVSLGNTVLEIGVHLAASLPECLYLEFSDLSWNDIAVTPIRFEQGQAITPELPGHGIEVDRDKLDYFSQPT